MKPRASGILLHLTSLPSPFGIGDMGSGAYRFADFLAKSGQRYSQILPLSPTETGHGHSPYHSLSAFAGNPLLISPEPLVAKKLLPDEVLKFQPAFPEKNVHFRAVTSYKDKLFRYACEHFKAAQSNDDYERFCRQNADWLDDFALFRGLRRHFRGRSWNTWPPPLRDRDPGALKLAHKKLQPLVEREKYLQYFFELQWQALKEYCNEKGIRIIGDIPIYMPCDSADVWSHSELFKLDRHKQPLAVSGVPPDYFSETGQLWGHPLYRWDMLQQSGYDWWIRRIRRNLALFDVVRIDHFRGFVAYWEVPVEEKTAINGKWVPAPAKDFFSHLLTKFSCLPIIAEDLGTITADVREIIRQFDFPGMRLLLFAFGDDFPESAFLPHNLAQNCVAYTGTHDNNTVRGWFENEATKQQKERLSAYLGCNLPADRLPWELIRLLMMSPADTVIFPMQDVLALGEGSRMNRPSSTNGNWLWRLSPQLLMHAPSHKLLEMTTVYQRV